MYRIFMILSRFSANTQDAELMREFISAEIKINFASPRKLSKSLTRRNTNDIFDLPDSATGKLGFSVRIELS